VVNQQAERPCLASRQDILLMLVLSGFAGLVYEAVCGLAYVRRGERTRSTICPPITLPGAMPSKERVGMAEIVSGVLPKDQIGLRVVAPAILVVRIVFPMSSMRAAELVGPSAGRILGSNPLGTILGTGLAPFFPMAVLIVDLLTAIRARTGDWSGCGRQAPSV